MAEPKSSSLFGSFTNMLSDGKKSPAPSSSTSSTTGVAKKPSAPRPPGSQSSPVPPSKSAVAASSTGVVAPKPKTAATSTMVNAAKKAMTASNAVSAFADTNGTGSGTGSVKKSPSPPSSSSPGPRPPSSPSTPVTTQTVSSLFGSPKIAMIDKEGLASAAREAAASVAVTAASSAIATAAAPHLAEARAEVNGMVKEVTSTPEYMVASVVAGVAADVAKQRATEMATDALAWGNGKASTITTAATNGIATATTTLNTVATTIEDERQRVMAEVKAQREQREREQAVRDAAERQRVSDEHDQHERQLRDERQRRDREQLEAEQRERTARAIADAQERADAAQRDRRHDELLKREEEEREAAAASVALSALLSSSNPTSSFTMTYTAPSTSTTGATPKKPAPPMMAPPSSAPPPVKSTTTTTAAGGAAKLAGVVKRAVTATSNGAHSIDNELAKLAERLGDAMQEKAELIAENKRLTMAMAKGGGANDELLRRAIEAERKLEAMKGQVTFKKMENDRAEMVTLRADNESKSTQLEEAKRKISELSTKFDLERKILQSTTTEREAYRQDGDNLRKQLDAQRTYSSEMEAKLKVCTADNERLTAIIKTARVEQDKEMNAMMGRWQAEKDEIIERKNSFRRLADSLKRELMRNGGGGRGDIKLVEENKRIKEELQRRSKSLQDALMALGMAQDSPARPITAGRSSLWDDDMHDDDSDNDTPSTTTPAALSPRRPIAIVTSPPTSPSPYITRVSTPPVGAPTVINPVPAKRPSTAGATTTSTVAPAKRPTTATGAATTTAAAGAKRPAAPKAKAAGTTGVSAAPKVNGAARRPPTL